MIERLQGNQDEQSWEDFLRIYRPYIHAIIRNMNIPEHEVDDIVQQVMLKLWKYIKSYSFEKRFRNWLSSVTANCVRDYINTKVKAAERLEEMSHDHRLSYLSAVRMPEIDRIAEREWGLYLTNLALERVGDLFSGKAMQVFMMSLEGMGAEEIARKMELKENSVYRLKNRVKVRLALEIEQLRSELE
ncbi:hypothetical protein SCARR_00903 [Pontiella sulfatireligans]|uniref:RNA polymerase sigma factor SigS n=2 Tax=Pontiella sulfatireligans TaxID=2750658 RepID=A0A6C2UF99_9BACT|nr:hypothetical protein SCARR_00903 [Pontiella sulfatireligans]